MSNTTITSYGTASTYTLQAPITNGSNIDFLNGNDTIGGVLILDDNAANSAFNVTTTTVNGTLYASANIGGTVHNFLPGSYDGKIGDQITLNVIQTLFAELDVASTASTDNASFNQYITFAASNGIQFLILPGGTVDVTPNGQEAITLDANTQLIIDEMADALFATGAANATLDLAFTNIRINPNNNSHLIDGVFTTQNPINPCFCAGTRILTPRGEIPVEDLNPGDLVITRAGEEQPIIWIGRREIDIASHNKPETLRPIIIEAGALAENVPARQLNLSPDHALYFDGVLVPAKNLVNHTSIRHDLAATHITYFHLELSFHDVIFAENTPAETYLDTGHRGVFDNAPNSPILLHPATQQQRRTAESCAPLCLTGPTLAAIRHRIAARQVGIRLG